MCLSLLWAMDVSRSTRSRLKSVNTLALGVLHSLAFLLSSHSPGRIRAFRRKQLYNFLPISLDDLRIVLVPEDEHEKWPPCENDRVERNSPGSLG